MNVIDLPPGDSLVYNATGRRRMVELGQSFPSLRRAPLADKHGHFDARYFARWANRSLYSSGERHAARFILSVWNPRVRWAIGRFDLHDALGTWDLEHRAAFARWTAAPWWP